MNNFELIRAWAEARNLIKGATAVSQFAKLVSEYGELAGHIEEMAELPCSIPKSASDEDMAKFAEDEQKLVDAMIDDIGDMLVVLTIIGTQLGVKIEEIGPESLVKGTEMLQLAIAFGKIGDAILKSDVEAFRGLVSCVFALLAVMSSDLGSTVDAAMSAAYEDIKDRKGVMYNGTFIKSTDERYEFALKEIGIS